MNKPIAFVLTILTCIVCCSAYFRTSRAFKLTESSDTLELGDYYKTDKVTYHFNGKGDANSMDETPIMNESSWPTLDSIVKFLKKNTTIRVRIRYVPSNNTPTYDSCVECNFEESIRGYIVSMGIEKQRVLGGYYNGDTVAEQNAHKVPSSVKGPNDNYLLLVVDSKIK